MPVKTAMTVHQIRMIQQNPVLKQHIMNDAFPATKRRSAVLIAARNVIQERLRIQLSQLQHVHTSLHGTHAVNAIKTAYPMEEWNQR